MKKKILFINGHLKAGGIERLLVDILKNLDYEKYDVDLLLLEGLGEYKEQLPKPVNIKCFDLSNTYGSLFSSLKRCLIQKDWRCFLIRILIFLSYFFKNKVYRSIAFLLLGKCKYDFVISMRFGYCLKIAAFGVCAKQRIEWWNNGDFGSQSAEVLHIDLKQFNKIIAVSETIKDFLWEQFPDLKHKIIVINNGIDIDSIQQKAKAFEPYMNNKDKYLICSVGRINPEKRYELAMDVAKELRNSKKFDFEWYIVGDGIDYEKIKTLIPKFRLEEYVHLVGAKENPYPYIVNADVFVHTSSLESFGLSIIEAMALKTPCIVTESRGPQNYMKNGVNGFLVDDDVKTIVDAIMRLKNDKILKKQIISEGYKTALSFNIINTVRQFEEYILEK